MIPLIIITIKSDPKWDWEAISAISNIVVAFATFLAVIVSLWIANSSSKPKLTILENTGTFEGTNVSYRIVNKGFIQVTILRNGFIVNRPFWKRKKGNVIDRKTGSWSIEQSGHHSAFINRYGLSRKLIALGFKPGEKVRLKVIFVDLREKRYTKNFSFLVFDPESEDADVNLTLNDSSGV